MSTAIRRHRWRTHLSLAVPLSLAWSAGATAASTDCPDLAARVLRGLPAGQNGAAIMGPSVQVKPPGRHAAIPPSTLDSVNIKLERSECYGTCPIYSVEVRGDGSTSYDGKGYVLVPGHHDASIPEADVECLLARFRKADFWSLADKYEADISDSPQYTLTLTIGGHTKSLIDYVGQAVAMPDAVTALEDEVDRLAADRWVRGTDDTLPSLRKENFDFHSKAAANILANGAAAAPHAVILGLLDAGTPVTGELVGHQWRPGTTAVESASRTGRTAIVEALIARGAFAAGPPDVKERALRAGAATGDPRLVADILKAKPDVDARGREGDTALIEMWRARLYAPDQRKVDIPAVAELLLAAGADPSITNDFGNTALFGASDARVVTLLIKAGAKIDVRNKFGDTPLLQAATDAAAVALIEAGADTTAKSKSGERVEHMARQRKFAETLRLLHDKPER